MGLESASFTATTQLALLKVGEDILQVQQDTTIVTNLPQFNYLQMQMIFLFNGLNIS